MDKYLSKFEFTSVDSHNNKFEERTIWTNGYIIQRDISIVLLRVDVRFTFLTFMDRFLVSGSLIPFLGTHRVWTHCSDISDHYPIILEWNKQRTSFNYPFKFNRPWLNDQDFSEWVSSKWHLLSQIDSESALDSLLHKLRTLKPEAKLWIKKK